MQSTWVPCTGAEVRLVVQASEVTQPLGQEVNLHRAGPALHKAGGEAPLSLSRRLAMSSGTRIYTRSKALGPRGGKKMEGVMTEKESEESELSLRQRHIAEPWRMALQGPGCLEFHPHLLLGLDPHVFRSLLAVFAFVRAAGWTLGRLQPRGSGSHHLHGWHTATTTLWKERQGWSGTVLYGTPSIGGGSLWLGPPYPGSWRPGDPSRTPHNHPRFKSPLSPGSRPRCRR